jgi:hypothetical protein
MSNGCPQQIGAVVKSTIHGQLASRISPDHAFFFLDLAVACKWCRVKAGHVPFESLYSMWLP